MIEKSKLIHEHEVSLARDLETVNREKERIILEYRNKAHTDINARYHALDVEHDQQKQECLTKAHHEHNKKLADLEIKLEVLDKVFLKNKDKAVNAVIQEVFKYGNR